MEENKNGLKRFLSLSWGYQFFQNLVGNKKAYDILVKEYIHPFSGFKLLDIGCGIGEILDHLPENIEYTGFDISPKYIKSAQNKYGSRGTFICGDISTTTFLKSSYEIIIAVGVLHHLNDIQSSELISLAFNSLKLNGRLITIDPVFVKEQSFIAKWVIKKDRGKFVRKTKQYLTIGGVAFHNIKYHIRNDMLRIPYNHIIMTATKLPNIE